MNEELLTIIEEIKNMDMREHNRTSVWDSEEITGSEARARIINLIRSHLHEER